MAGELGRSDEWEAEQLKNFKDGKRKIGQVLIDLGYLDPEQGGKLLASETHSRSEDFQPSRTTSSAQRRRVFPAARA